MTPGKKQPIKSKVVQESWEQIAETRELELVVRINMKDKGPQSINVYEGDTADDLAREFCIKHSIADRGKQAKLLHSLEYQIQQHRRPPSDSKQYQEAQDVADHGELNPETVSKVLEIFNEIWYEYDEDDGSIDMQRYKQIMKSVQKHKRIPNAHNPEDDLFSNENLEAAFRQEDSVKYNDRDKVGGRISHRSVMYIVHDIFEKYTD